MMNQDMISRMNEWVRRYWIAVTGLTIAGIYLVTQHLVHVLPFLPFALVLLCPLSMFFMHGGHGNHGGHDHTGHEHMHLSQKPLNIIDSHPPIGE